MEHLLNDHNQHKNSHKLWDETGHPVVNLMKSQWKLRQSQSEFLNGGKTIVEQMLGLEEVNKKEQDCESHSQGSEQES